MIGKKVKNRFPASTKAARIGKLTDYIRTPETEQAAEKCIYSGARGFLSDTPAGQTAEMIAVASEAVKSKDPISHYVLSWKEGETPTPKQIEQAVDVFLAEFQMTGHQVIYGLHVDTDNHHLHIAVNRVHPETLKVAAPNKGFDIELVHRAVARIEHAQGWEREARGRYKVNAAGEIVRAPDAATRQPSARAADKETATGEKSVQRHGIEKASSIISKAATWAALHAGLAAIGMRYERTGSGAVIHIGDVAVKASSVDRKASFAQLEKRLGRYHDHNHNQEQTNGQYYQHAPQKPHARPPQPLSANHMCRLSACSLAKDGRDKKGPRVLQIDARVSGRKTGGVRRSGSSRGTGDGLKRDSAGWREYNQARKAYNDERAREAQDLKAQHDAAIEALKQQHKAYREEVFTPGKWKGRGVAANALRSVIAAEQAGAKLTMREIQQRERVALRERMPAFNAYEDWLKARGAHEQADAWRYKASPEQQPGRIFATKDIRDFKHVATERGVKYRARDAGFFSRSAFIDRGRRIDVIKTKDAGSVLAALQLGQQKFGVVTITGSAEYRALCVQLAAAHGISLGNPELQDALAAAKVAVKAMRREEAQHTSPSAPLTPARSAQAPLQATALEAATSKATISQPAPSQPTPSRPASSPATPSQSVPSQSKPSRPAPSQPTASHAMTPQPTASPPTTSQPPPTPAYIIPDRTKFQDFDGPIIDIRDGLAIQRATTGKLVAHRLDDFAAAAQQRIIGAHAAGDKALLRYENGKAKCWAIRSTSLGLERGGRSK